MEEVLLQDGNITYREAGRVHGKRRASGAQRTIIGLGLKLGLVRLVPSNFDCLILDEVSADMCPEVSMRCMLAINSFCGQTIAVTHRSLDVAGNVIELG
jgi:DNA repair exonuclease SbcCD ATPase subunit